jgi:hypothetical protein
VLDVDPTQTRCAAPRRSHAPARLALALVLGALALAPAPARAVETELAALSPGVKLGWTFGRGLTFGVEVSWIWAPTTVDDWKEHPYATGVVVDLDTNFKGLWKLHLGGELVGPFVGIEAGPSLVVDRGEWLLGLGITPWAGYDVIPYYSYTYVFGGERNLHEVGSYLKLVLDPDGDGKNSHDDWDD